MTSPTRPTTIDEVLAILSRFRTPEAAAKVQALDVRPSDVFICTYTKSGTTWTQQIVHQLRSGCSMAFREINEVVPWLETAHDMGIDPTAEQVWRPRAFKTHLMWRDVPRGGRYITVFRNPVDVLPSFFRFFEGWFFEPGSISLDDFASRLYLHGSAAGRHWDHLVDWWPRVADPDVLALSYEDMVAAPDRVTAVVAEFLGLELDASVLEEATEHSSREFMAAHAEQFSEGILRERRDPIWGLPSGGDSAKVTPGSMVDLGADLRGALDAAWTEIVTPVTGHRDYAEFRSALPDPLGIRT